MISIPMRSCTAERIRCLQPRYRAVVCMEAWPQKELNLLQFASQRRDRAEHMCDAGRGEQEYQCKRFGCIFDDVPNRCLGAVMNFAPN